MRISRPATFGFGLVTIAMLLVPASYFVTLRERDASAARAALAEAVAATDALDPGWRWADLPSGSAEDQTVASLIGRFGTDGWAGRGSPEERIDFAFDRLSLVPENQFPDDQIAGHFKNPTEKLAARYAEARQIVGLPIGLPIRESEVTLNGRPTPHLVGARYASRLFRAGAFEHAMRGRPDESTKDLRGLAVVIRSLRTDSRYISQLVAETLSCEAARCVERVVGMTDRPADLAEWQALLAEHLDHPSVESAMRGERAWWDAVFTRIENEEIELQEVLAQFALPGEQQTSPSVDAFRTLPRVPLAHAEMLRWFNDVIAVSALPSHQQSRAFRQIGGTVRETAHPVLASMYRQSFESMAGHARSSRTVVAAAVVALACERHRLDKGDWPTNLAALVPAYLTAIPADPVDGRPIRYVRRADGICVYGVGHDGTDNDGNLTDTRYGGLTDIGVRVWNEAERRQPHVERLVAMPRER